MRMGEREPAAGRVWRKALVPAVSRLVSTPVRVGDIASNVGVGMSADAAGMSACATGHSNTCEKRRLHMSQAVEVSQGTFSTDNRALVLDAGVGSHGSHPVADGQTA